MRVVINSTYMIRNLKNINLALEKANKEFYLSKTTDDRFEIEKDELLVFRILSAKTRHITLEQIKSNSVSKTKYDSDIYVTNKYVRIFGYGEAKIELKDIIEVEILHAHAILKTKTDIYELTLNSIEFQVQLLFVLDFLNSVKLDDSKDKCKITIGITEMEDNSKKTPPLAS